MTVNESNPNLWEKTKRFFIRYEVEVAIVTAVVALAALIR